MCEGAETEAHFRGLKHILEHLLPTHDWHVKGIWADATEAEEKAAWPKDHPVLRKCVYKLQPNDPDTKKNNILPSFKADAEHCSSYTLPLESLELQGIHNSSRAVILDFGIAWLKVGAN